MQRYVAFLRALNVGGHTVKMDHLRSLFEALGFERVESFIASGNIIFDAPAKDAAAKLEERIERHLHASLGYAVATFLRTPEEVAAVAAYRPFPGADPVPEGHTLNVIFLKSEPGKEAREKVEALRSEYDDLRVHGRELYWWAHGRSSDSPMKPGAIEKAVGKGTARNITTVRKLAQKYAGG